MDINEIVETLKPLYEIGRGHGGNGNYQRLLATAIKQTGKPVNNFTIGEMLTLIKQVKTDFNGVRQFCTAFELGKFRPD